MTYSGVPIMASNMDTTGTFKTAKAFESHKMFVCIHKHYPVEEWVEFAESNPAALEVLRCLIIVDDVS